MAYTAMIALTMTTDRMADVSRERIRNLALSNKNPIGRTTRRRENLKNLNETCLFFGSESVWSKVTLEDIILSNKETLEM